MSDLIGNSENRFSRVAAQLCLLEEVTLRKTVPLRYFCCILFRRVFLFKAQISLFIRLKFSVSIETFLGNSCSIGLRYVF